MSRTPTEAGTAHRDEQRRYRERLRRERVPEVAQVDTSIAAGAYALLRRLKAEGAGREETDYVLRTALDALARMGFDRAGAQRVLKRRLVRPNNRFDTLTGLVERGRDGTGQ